MYTYLSWWLLRKLYFLLPILWNCLEEKTCICCSCSSEFLSIWIWYPISILLKLTGTFFALKHLLGCWFFSTVDFYVLEIFSTRSFLFVSWFLLRLLSLFPFLDFPISILPAKSSGTSLVARTLKRLPTVRETWVRSLAQEDPLEEEMATHSRNFLNFWPCYTVSLPHPLLGWSLLPCPT